jgi:dTDP-4-amino-4,6-dideoxygalactose transaminase
VSSGTAALHLALHLAGVEPGDEVLCSTLTFVATANPILYLGARPVFVDSDHTSWNMDPRLLQKALEQRVAQGKRPKAVVLVHLYGQSADIDPILAACHRYDIPLIEDAAEALGATYKGRSPGTLGHFGIFSFNGNKIITTSGGGMVVSHRADLVQEARFLATQARDPAPHYRHSAMGYNYRLSNVLAGIGRGQLQVLADRVPPQLRALPPGPRRPTGASLYARSPLRPIYPLAHLPHHRPRSVWL